MSSVSLGLLVCSVTTLVLAQGPAKESNPPILVKGGQPPIIGVVEGVQDGKLLVRQHRPETRTATRTKPVRSKVVVDGKEVEKTEYITETYSFTAMAAYSVAHDMANVRVFDTNGTPIAASRIAALFPQPRMVLMATAGMQVDPAYLKIARDGTPFVALPEVPVEPVAPPAP